VVSPCEIVAAGAHLRQRGRFDRVYRSACQLCQRRRVPDEIWSPVKFTVVPVLLECQPVGLMIAYRVAGDRRRSTGPTLAAVTFEAFECDQRIFHESRWQVVFAHPLERLEDLEMMPPGRRPERHMGLDRRATRNAASKLRHHHGVGVGEGEACASPFPHPIS